MESPPAGDSATSFPPRLSSSHQSGGTFNPLEVNDSSDSRDTVVTAGTSPDISGSTSTHISHAISRRVTSSTVENHPLNPTGSDSGRPSEARQKFSIRCVQFLRDLRARPFETLRKHWLWLCVFSVLACLTASLPVGWALRIRAFNGKDYIQDADVILMASLISVNTDQQSMTMDWRVVDFGQDCTQYTRTSISLFFDQYVIQSAKTSFVPLAMTPAANLRRMMTIPPIRYSSLMARSGALMTASATTSHSAYFRTYIDISNVGTGRSSQAYPFDEYTAEIFIFATLPDNTTVVPVSISATSGVAVGFNTKIVAKGLTDSGGLDNVFTVTRGPVVRVYAISIVIAIWLVTLTFLATCVAVVFLRRGVPAAVLVLPVATLFAFTSLRSTLPGAPVGFGADIDFMGILPCLAIITFCSVFMTAVFLFHNPEKDMEEEKRVRDLEKNIRENLPRILAAMMAGQEKLD